MANPPYKAMTSVFGTDKLSLLNKENVLASLKDDPLLTGAQDEETNKDPATLDYDAILRKESCLNQQLHDLSSLRSVSGLIMEFKANFELLEFENCYYSLQSLRKKLRDNAAINKQGVSFQQSVLAHADAMHSQLVHKFYEIITQHFWQVTDESIAFEPIVGLGDDSEDLDYVPFMSFIEQQFYSDGFLDANLWIIGDMRAGPTQDEVIFELNAIFHDYLNSRMIIEVIKKFLFSKAKQIVFERGSCVKLKLHRDGEDKVSDRIANINSVACFLCEGISVRDIDTFAKKLGPVLATELIQTVKSNPYTVLHSSHSQIRADVAMANQNLRKLAKKSNWTYHGSDVESLLNDNQVQNRLLLDGIFEQYALKIRSMFKGSSFKRLDSVFDTHLQTANPLTLDTAVSQTEGRVHKASEGEAEDNWEWGEDAVVEEADDGDGWANELTIDFGESNMATPRKTRRLSERSVSDETAGWDEEIKINFDEISPAALHKTRRFSQKSSKSQKSQKSQKSEGWGWDLDSGEDNEKSSSMGRNPSSQKHPGGGHIKVSKMSGVFLSIMEELEKEITLTGRSRFDEHSCQHKLNVFQTLFFAISITYFQEDWWQLFVNLRFITNHNPKLTRLQELNIHLLEIYTNSSFKVVAQLVDEQMQQFFISEKEPSWAVTESKLLPFVRRQIIEPLNSIGDKDGANYLLQFYCFFYVDCISDNILKWEVISERNSENLAHLVSTVYDGTDTSILRDNAQYLQYRDKFIIIGQLLELHLKEIMAMFYNGDFYLFTTEELVQWLTLLFADTPLRQDAINEIHEIRQASNLND
ncbi:DSL1 (YNL258C) [Zygosaccharomyces parabailii]|nr:DSL1 (YNL258C) [Zygosaccharomyces parabailii]CDH09752.1 related to Protein transport protein DSL1 [Zygosaccharomyces bailii ISA1307]